MALLAGSRTDFAAAAGCNQTDRFCGKHRVPSVIGLLTGEAQPHLVNAYF